ncbi:exo-alpha-sialidase [Trypanosoma cruzi]|nr:exo-alpha-sialidase [Trypanosoma cruzi]
MVTTNRSSHGGCVVIRNASKQIEQSSHTIQPAECKKAQPPSQHPRAATSRIAVVSSNAPAHHSTRPEDLPSPNQQRRRHVGRNSCWEKVNRHSSQAPEMPQHSLTARRQHHARNTSPKRIAGSQSPNS